MSEGIKKLVSYLSMTTGITFAVVEGEIFQIIGKTIYVPKNIDESLIDVILAPLVRYSLEINGKDKGNLAEEIGKIEKILNGFVCFKQSVSKFPNTVNFYKNNLNFNNMAEKQQEDTISAGIVRNLIFDYYSRASKDDFSEFKTYDENVLAWQDKNKDKIQNFYNHLDQFSK